MCESPVSQGESDRYPEEAAKMQRVSSLSCASWRLKEIRSRSGGRRAVLQTVKKLRLASKRRQEERTEKRKERQRDMENRFTIYEEGGWNGMDEITGSSPEQISPLLSALLYFDLTSSTRSIDGKESQARRKQLLLCSSDRTEKEKEKERERVPCWLYRSADPVSGCLLDPGCIWMHFNVYT